jgi:hypothetical protein
MKKRTLTLALENRIIAAKSIAFTARLLIYIYKSQQLNGNIDRIADW